MMTGQLDLFLLDRSNLLLWPLFTSIVALLVASAILGLVHRGRLGRWSLVANPASPASTGTLLLLIVALGLLSGGGFFALCLSRPIVAADLNHVTWLAGSAGLGGLVGAWLGAAGGRWAAEWAYRRTF